MDVEPDVLFEFVHVLKGDPRGIQRLPDSFAEYVGGVRPRTMHLREHSCGYYRWIVDVIYDARGYNSVSLFNGMPYFWYYEGIIPSTTTQTVALQ
jgi:hypothetical protein